MTEISPKKQQIYLEAARLFHHRGYAATSMRAIADAVDLEVSSLYSHIRSKEELLHEICFRVAGQFLEAIRQIRQKWDDPRVQLEELLRFHLRLALEDPTSATVFSDEWKHLRTDELAVFLDQRKQYEQQFLGIIREGQAMGIFSGSASQLDHAYDDFQFVLVISNTNKLEAGRTRTIDGVVINDEHEWYH